MTQDVLELVAHRALCLSNFHQSFVKSQQKSPSTGNETVFTGTLTVL